MLQQLLLTSLQCSVCGCHVLCCCSHRVVIIRCAAYRQRQSVILFYDTGYLFQIKTQLIHRCVMPIEEPYGQKEKM